MRHNYHEKNNESEFTYPLPFWNICHLGTCKRDAFILNYWLTPSFYTAIYAFPSGAIADWSFDPSFLIGSVTNIPLSGLMMSFNSRSSLNSNSVSVLFLKFFVSIEFPCNTANNWGIPKELANLWMAGTGTRYPLYDSFCSAMYAHTFKKQKQCSFYINSHYLPAAVLKIRHMQQCR